MIDWCTLRLPYAQAPELADHLAAYSDRIVRIGKTGEIVWEVSAWDSVRSDSHGLSMRSGGDSFFIQGSPARVVGDGLNVFGTDDVLLAAQSMIAYASKAVGLHLPADPRKWKLSRLDVTYNYFLPSLADVRSALAYLRGVEGGRYRVSQQSGDTVYWSHRSHLRSGKAYAKGPHMRYLLSKCDDMTLAEDQLSLLDCLLRLELSLKSQFWRERSPFPWYAYTPALLRELHAAYFEQMIGDVEVPVSHLEFLQSLERVAGSPGKARAALATWQTIKVLGYETTRCSMPARTWYRHLAALRAVGLGDGDLATGSVLPFRRRKLLVLDSPVTSWDELRKIAA